MKRIYLCLAALSLLVLLAVSCATDIQQSSVASANETGLSSMQLDHFLIGTADYDGTMQWYQDKLGATVDVEWTVEGLSDLRLAYLAINGDRIEVIGSLQSIPGAPEPDDFAEHLRTAGYSHICFSVDDVDATMAQLAQRDVPAFVPAADYANLNARVSFIKDNNGNVIEFTGPMANT